MQVKHKYSEIIWCTAYFRAEIDSRLWWCFCYYLIMVCWGTLNTESCLTSQPAVFFHNRKDEITWGKAVIFLWCGIVTNLVFINSSYNRCYLLNHINPDRDCKNPWWKLSVNGISFEKSKLCLSEFSFLLEKNKMV